MNQNQINRPKLAVISTYNELCGIAAYTERLERYLTDDFDVTVLKLDQSILRSDTPRRMKLAEKHIDDICRQIRSYDAVNIQYEPGTLGPTGGIAFKRLKRIVQASPALSVTFHTFAHSGGFPTLKVLKAFSKLKAGHALSIAKDWWRSRAIGASVFKLLKAEEKHKHVSLIVHTKREAGFLKLDYDFKNVFDHPLSFLREEDVVEAKEHANRADFPPLRDVDGDSKIIGVFGFIAPYKGTLCAVRALRYLPENYHLAIFGAIHPAEIHPHVDLNRYLHEIMREMTGYSDTAAAEDLATGLERIAIEQMRKNRSDISHRVHFMGSLDEEQFAHGMALCDTVVLPYLEVGQTSSGPISFAVELGKPIVGARNHAFAQFARYHQDRIDFFDIGNHIELADRVLKPYVSEIEPPIYSYETNRAVYVAAHTPGASMPVIQPAKNNTKKTHPEKQAAGVKLAAQEIEPKEDSIEVLENA
ncbi:MAG: hypothetical protein ACWA5W_10560 [Phycisphaerales bacterium]